MDTYTVSFFGHRYIYRPFEVEKRLEKIITELINTKNYVEFLVGKEGDFDTIVSSTIRGIVKKNELKNSSLVLVMPYIKSSYKNNEEYYSNYYDEIELCNESVSAHFKVAIQIRNRSMVDRSDLVLCYIEKESGGAYKTIQYAQQKNKLIINVADNTLFEDKE